MEKNKKLGLGSVVSVSVGLVIATSCLVSLGQGAGTVGIPFIGAMIIACLLNMTTVASLSELNGLMPNTTGGLAQYTLACMYLQKVCADTPWFTDIQQATQKLPLGVCVCRYPQSPILRVFFQKHLNKDCSPLTPVHSQTLFSIVCLGQASAHRPQWRQWCWSMTTGFLVMSMHFCGQTE